MLKTPEQKAKKAEYDKARRLSKSDEIRAYDKARHCDARRESNRIRTALNPELNRERAKAWAKANKKRYNERIKAWHKKNPGYRKERYFSKPLYVMAGRIRGRINKALARKGMAKTTSTAAMLGCTWEELIYHIESLFKDGMTWENRGEWHIDHVVPLSSADNEKDMIILGHHKNLQPLWAVENLSKGSSSPKGSEVFQATVECLP